MLTYNGSGYPKLDFGVPGIRRKMGFCQIFWGAYLMDIERFAALLACFTLENRQKCSKNEENLFHFAL